MHPSFKLPCHRLLRSGMPFLHRQCGCCFGMFIAAGEKGMQPGFRAAARRPCCALSVTHGKAAHLLIGHADVLTDHRHSQHVIQNSRTQLKIAINCRVCSAGADSSPAVGRGQAGRAGGAASRQIGIATTFLVLCGCFKSWKRPRTRASKGRQRQRRGLQRSGLDK